MPLGLPAPPASLAPTPQRYATKDFNRSAAPAQMNMTGSNPAVPGNTSVGGIFNIKSLTQTLEDERVEAEKNAVVANNTPVIQGLVAYIRKCWSDAKIAKENTVEPRMVASLDQRAGRYPAHKLAEFAEQNSVAVYMMLTGTKCRAASAWMRDVLLTVNDDKPWTIEPTPVAELAPDVMNAIVESAAGPIAQVMAVGVDPSQADVRELLMIIKEEMATEVQEKANAATERMSRKMQDQLLEGGFVQALSEFIDDLTTFPSAILKGPVVRKKPQLCWYPDAAKTGSFKLETKDKLVLEWERTDPKDIYPAPDSSRIEDSYLIERHRMSRGDLQALKGTEGYADDAIDAVLKQYGAGGLHEWIQIDTTGGIAEGKSSTAISSNPSKLIDALQFWGPVQGQMLIDWGMKKKDVPDPLKEYNIEAWLIGTWIIKASINPDPLARRPYYKASYEELPGSFWGNSVSDLCRDTQDICNAAARALVNNMSIASGPQVVCNVDRLPLGENLNQMFPWKIWQVTSDPAGGSGKPIDFFSPTSNAQELMAIYEKFAVLADEYTNIPRYMTGDSPAGGAGRTASGMSMLMSNAGKGIKQVIASIDVRVIEKAIDRLYFYNMRYGEDPDLKGDIKIVARGATSLMMKENAQQRRNEFLQIALSNEIVHKVVGMEGIAVMLRETAKTLDLNTDKIVPPLPVLKQRWAAEQKAVEAQQAQLMAQQAAMDGAPINVNMQRAPGGSPAAPPGNGQQLMDGAPVTDNFSPTPQ